MINLLLLITNNFKCTLYGASASSIFLLKPPSCTLSALLREDDPQCNLTGNAALCADHPDLTGESLLYSPNVRCKSSRHPSRLGIQILKFSSGRNSPNQTKRRVTCMKKPLGASMLSREGPSFHRGGVSWGFNISQLTSQ